MDNNGFLNEPNNSPQSKRGITCLAWKNMKLLLKMLFSPLFSSFHPNRGKYGSSSSSKASI